LRPPGSGQGERRRDAARYQRVATNILAVPKALLHELIPHYPFFYLTLRMGRGGQSAFFAKRSALPGRKFPP